jgi:hypothetical protein
MSVSLPDRFRRVLHAGRSLAEPFFDTENRVSNWPIAFVSEVQELIGAVGRSNNPADLRCCSELLARSDAHDIPEGLRLILARALFDNIDTPAFEHG